MHEIETDLKMLTLFWLCFSHMGVNSIITHVLSGFQPHVVRLCRGYSNQNLMKYLHSLDFGVTVVDLP